jgi:ATP-dependent Clp endopeptidase proteolytic subunit ClpP
MAKAIKNKAVIYIYDVIGEWGLKVSDFAMQLTELESQGADEFEVHINSAGGNVFDGIAIYNLLKSRDVTVHIDGLAASIASVIAMAGKSIKMYKNAMIMIHNPWTYAQGDAKELERVQKNLEVIKQQITKAYIDKTGLDEATLIKYMDEVKYFTADEALANKFVDEILDQPTEKDYIGFYVNLISNKKNNPKGVIKMKALLKFLGLDENATEQEVDQYLSTLRTKYKLPATATLTDIVDAVKNTASQDVETKFENRIKVLEEKDIEKTEAEKQAQAKAKAESLVDNAIENKKILPADKDVFVQSALTDFDKTKATLDAKVKNSAIPKTVIVNNNVVDLNDANAIARAAEDYKNSEASKGRKMSYAAAVKVIKEGKVQ